MPRFCGMMDHNGGFGLLALGSLGRPTVGVLVYNSFFRSGTIDTKFGGRTGGDTSLWRAVSPLQAETLQACRQGCAIKN